eukprot:scaffold101551_cov19-Tisochrysis_lutea.AAC.1
MEWVPSGSFQRPSNTLVADVAEGDPSSMNGMACKMHSSIGKAKVKDVSILLFGVDCLPSVRVFISLSTRANILTLLHVMPNKSDFCLAHAQDVFKLLLGADVAHVLLEIHCHVLDALPCPRHALQ